MVYTTIIPAVREARRERARRGDTRAAAMDVFTTAEMEDAARAIARMIGRSGKARAAFAPGTAQHTLLKNRMNALEVALALIEDETAGGDAAADYTKEELERAAAPIASLAGKSEKARQKLAKGTWQETMLGDNLSALRIASLLLARALCRAEDAPWKREAP